MKAAAPVQSQRAGARIPSLDGMRAVAICLVIIAHLADSGTLPIATHLERLQPGNLGVRVFFVISGFLITSLLLNESRNTGRIDLRAFYVRRFFRIMPAFWVFLATVALLIPLGVVTARYSDLVTSFFYLSNYLRTTGAVGHTWSLAVEEQFYLLWPALVFFAPRRVAFLAAAAMLVIAPLLRVAADHFGAWTFEPAFAFETVCDALAVGCLLAGWREKLWSFSAYRWWVGSKRVYLLLLAVLAFRVTPPLAIVWDAFGVTMLNLSIALILDHVMREPRTLVGRVLNSRPFVTVGVLSYSIYLWQQIFLYWSHPVRFPLNVALIGVVAAASYYLVERPCLELKKRFVSATAS
jgi:peptidoglycan/LPS O-acetylase OafA/YrhL